MAAAAAAPNKCHIETVRRAMEEAAEASSFRDRAAVAAVVPSSFDDSCCSRCRFVANSNQLDKQSKDFRSCSNLTAVAAAAAVTAALVLAMSSTRAIGFVVVRRTFAGDWRSVDRWSTRRFAAAAATAACMSDPYRRERTRSSTVENRGEADQFQLELVPVGDVDCAGNSIHDSRSTASARPRAPLLLVPIAKRPLRLSCC